MAVFSNGVPTLAYGPSGSGIDRGAQPSLQLGAGGVLCRLAGCELRNCIENQRLPGVTTVVYSTPEEECTMACDHVCRDGKWVPDYDSCQPESLHCEARR